MKILSIILLCATYFSCAKCNGSDVANNFNSTNLTNSDKDMYIIHATVYQIGILTNRTDNMTDNFNSTGDQESVTLYHTNGTKVDLSKIPEPFLTNITAQTLVGVAAVPQNSGADAGNAWSALEQMRRSGFNKKDKLSPGEQQSKRSLDYNSFLPLFKRDTTPVKVENGAAVIPSEAGIQSISLPPLLSLNNNLTEIPVPIPNTSVVHYAKINTLVQKP